MEARQHSLSRRAALPPMTLACCVGVMPISSINFSPFSFKGTMGGESVAKRK
jgi:hypothetical protein